MIRITYAAAGAIAACALVLCAVVLCANLPAAAAPACPGNPDALGTARVIAADAATTPRVGRKHFPTTLPLADHEVVLTFDDGPWPGTTAAVLDALRHECVQASFFLLGQNALAHPDLARRELAEGHTVAHHSFAHPLLDRMAEAAARAEIDHGFATVDTALYGRPGARPHTPFFPLSGVRLHARPAGVAGNPRNRGFRCRSVGQRLESDDAGAGTRPGCGASGRRRWWNHLVS